MRQSLLLVLDQAVIAMDVADILAEVGFDVGATAYTLDEAREHVWHRRVDAGLLSPKVGGEPTFGIADWLTAWSIPTLFLTDRAADALPARHRGLPRIRMPLDARDLVLQVSQATGLLAPPETPALAPTGPVGSERLNAAKANIIEAEMRISRLRLLVSRYSTPEGKQLLTLHEHSLAHLRKTHDLLRDIAGLTRG